jgi:hypothetical protein
VYAPHFYGIIGRGKNCIMSVRIAIIGNDSIIADIKELIDPEDKARQYMFTKPFRVIMQPTMLLSEDNNETAENTSQVSLATWQPLTQETTFIVNPNSVQTIFEPVADLKIMYQEVTVGSN